MKRVLLILIGLIPLILGYLLNYLMFISMIPLFIIYFAVWIIWFIAGLISIKLVDRKTESILLLNTPAFLFLLLVLYQEIILSQYWPNLIGVIPQLFYTPFIYIGFRITPMFHSVFYAYIASFLIMLIVSFSGRLVSERRKKA